MMSEWIKETTVDNIMRFGHSRDEAERKFEKVLQEKRREAEAKRKRKEASLWQCRIPGWLDQDGMVDFWINDDGTFEADDSRFSDSDIRAGIRDLADW